MDPRKRSARLAGLLYLLLGATNLLGLLCAPLVLRDPADLAKVVGGSESAFRVRLATDLLSQVVGIFLVVVLYDLLRGVNRRLALAMLLLVVVAVPVSFVLTLNDVVARMFLKDGEALSTFTQPQLDSLATLFMQLHIQGVFALEIYWGLWLVPFGLLLIRSRAVPRILGVLLIVAGIAYVTHCFVSLLAPEFREIAYERATMVARGAGELPVMFWLLIKGADFGPSSAAAPARCA